MIDESQRTLSRASSTAPNENEFKQEIKEEPALTAYASASRSTSASSVTLPTPVTTKQRIASLWYRSFSVQYLMEDVHPDRVTFVLWCFCFMSGFINSVPFAAVLLWCGFQTGNTVQLAVAVGRFMTSSDVNFTFIKADQQALVSLLSYLVGGYMARYGDRMGSNTRAWLTLGTLLQALLTMAAALTIWKSGEPSTAMSRGGDSWENALSFVSLAFVSASMGLQGVMARRISSHFGATVVLTTLWSELISDPGLWKFGYVKSRDHRVLAVLAFFLGGMLGRGLLNHTGSASLFGVATGLRVLIALLWLFVPAK
ncbi:hypothetical protein ACEPAH_3907 [Sanghuangporus vaninii]